MSKFEIYTDSSCDLPRELIEKFEVKEIQLEVTVDENLPVLNKDIDPRDLYEKLRNGAMAKTNAATPGFFEENMKQSLSEGKDILYIGFTSALSVTFHNGKFIMDELKESFPERKLLYVDSLCASVGEGLLVHYAALRREEGACLEDVYAEIMAMKDKIHHQVTVNDLFFLKRGGRVSTTAAVAGSILSLKPMIEVSIDGKLNTCGTIRGRKAAMKALVSKMKENADIETWKHVFISHGDCQEDAEQVKAMVEEAFPNAQVHLSYVGAVIGAHTGPGVIALCYLGKTQKNKINMK